MARDSFMWTDDEVELLLQVTLEYKLAKQAEKVNWESVQSKYRDILERYGEKYPSPEEASAMEKHFPHTEEEVSKTQLTSKLKAIRLRFRRAVESGKKTGHSRIVLMYYEQLKAIWGGSAVTQAIAGGFIAAGGDVSLEAEQSTTSPENTAADEGHNAETTGSRRIRLEASIVGQRREKLKRKASHDAINQEDLSIKRRFLQQLEATDEEFVQTLNRWSSTMDFLNTNIRSLVQHIFDGKEGKETEQSRTTTEQSALKKKIKVILDRLPEGKPCRQSNRTEQQADVTWCSPMEVDTQHEEEGGHAHEGRENGGVEIKIEDADFPSPLPTPKENGEVQFTIENGNCPSPLPASAITEIQSKTDDDGSTNSLNADLSTSLGPGLPVMNSGVLGDIIVGDRSAKPRSQLVECVAENMDATTLKRITRDLQVSGTETVPSPSPGLSTGSDPDTMDLDQLKREKIRMQLKVLKLQEEYYTMKIKEQKE